MQIISLFHHLWFIRFKRSLSNTRKRFKGLSRKKTEHPGHEDWIKCPYNKG